MKVLDVATTYYGIKYLGCNEANLLVALLMEEYGTIIGIYLATRWYLLSLIGVTLLSIPRIGPTLATLVLGGFVGSLFPAVLSNLSRVFFNRGLSYARNMEFQWWFFVLGVIATFYAMDRQGLMTVTHVSEGKRSVELPVIQPPPRIRESINQYEGTRSIFVGSRRRVGGA